MNYSIPTDPHELSWLTDNAISAHCDFSHDGRFTLGFGVWYRSTVSLLLAETNHAKFYSNSGKLLPLLGALSALDQYGTCYSPDPSTFPAAFSNKSGIIKSAHNFLKILVNTPDSDALYALRNALMHQSSLISVGTQKIPKHYWFEIDNSISEIFSHATTAWDGKYNTRNSSNKTLVNSSRVLELTFTLIDILKSMHEQRKLQLVLPGGLEELLTTYVNLDFDHSLRNSYIRFVGTKIHDTLFSQPAGAASAKKVLASTPQKDIEEAAKWLVTQPGGPSLETLAQAYPSLLPSS